MAARRLLRTPRPDDGLADVVVSAAAGPVARLRYAWLLRQGRHTEHPDVVLTRGRTVELAGPPVPINSDGELGDGVSHRRWTAQPRAWRILAPEPGELHRTFHGHD